MTHLKFQSCHRVHFVSSFYAHALTGWSISTDLTLVHKVPKGSDHVCISALSTNGPLGLYIDGFCNNLVTE
jgi:hypothetical protein